MGKKTTSVRGEVLVAILNEPRDLDIAQNQHWYRIPVDSVEKWLSGRWPPRWLAFYQTKVFGDDAYKINYYAQVLDVPPEVERAQLFPDEPPGERSTRRYYQVMLGPLQRRPRPIVSRRWRRIVFIPTTWPKFANAVEINDLFDESPLEDLLWSELKRLEIHAERQEFVQVKRQRYALDFAIYCVSGNLDVETDGDSWHADRKRIPLDNRRDNDLQTAGWHVLRFNTTQLRERMAGYCLPTIVENVARLGGIAPEPVVPEGLLDEPEELMQLELFGWSPIDKSADVLIASGKGRLALRRPKRPSGGASQLRLFDEPVEQRKRHRRRKRGSS